MNTHKHYQLCNQAHQGTSFSPEKRAAMYCDMFDDYEKDVIKYGGSIEKHEKLFINWMSAKSRCLSPMITGPANFPVSRNEKSNRAESKRYDEYVGYINKLRINHEKEERYKKNPDSRPISLDDSDAEERLNSKIQKLKNDHEKMKTANKLVKKGDKQGLIDLLGEKTAQLMGTEKIEQFYFTNNLANIKRLEGQLIVLNRMKTIENNDEETRYVIDNSDMRVYFEFDGKPSDEIRTVLKASAFKWTPSKSHWGRKLTPNAISSAKQIEKKLQELE